MYFGKILNQPQQLKATRHLPGSPGHISRPRDRTPVNLFFCRLKYCALRNFTVNLIPHTLSGTTFDRARVGQDVNLEMDVLVKAARSGEPLADALRDGSGGRPATTVGGRSRDYRSSGSTLDAIYARGWRRR